MSELRTANVLGPPFAYDDTDPAGYRAGIAHLDKAVGDKALAVKAFELEGQRRPRQASASWRRRA
jgi:hypothetical protein